MKLTVYYASGKLPNAAFHIPHIVASGASWCGRDLTGYQQVNVEPDRPGICKTCLKAQERSQPK